MSTVNSISTTAGLTGSSSTKKTGDADLDKNSFLKLLTTQLKYQDPLKPADDTTFIAQLAQFSSLEQMQNMSSSLASSQAAGWLGKIVTWSETDSAGKTTENSGVVTALKIDGNKTQIVVNGQAIDADKVTNVNQTATVVTDSNSTSIFNAQLTSLIGKTITWQEVTKDSSGNTVTDSSGNAVTTEKSGVVTSIKFTSGNANVMVGSTAVDPQYIVGIQ
ncbi:MAG TPA: flagellar hook capping FlgD N-terminal domain-containing protein [Patescibacteria group bacterium]|nr:flagellar hook capping FlgD N-terminal domain-containing protein [Patescibacteria group bacterium]